VPIRTLNPFRIRDIVNGNFQESLVKGNTYYILKVLHMYLYKDETFFYTITGNEYYVEFHKKHKLYIFHSIKVIIRRILTDLILYHLDDTFVKGNI
jgi:hypothetical protein